MKTRLDMNPEGRFCLRSRGFHASIFLTTYLPSERVSVLLGDNSGSTMYPYQGKQAIEWEKDVLKQYLKALSSNPESLAGIMSFDDWIHLYFNVNGSFERKLALVDGDDYDTVFTTLIEKYRDKFFRNPEDPRNYRIIDNFLPGGYTAGGGAIYTAINLLDAVETAKNKQMVIVSDGLFNKGLGSLVRERELPDSDVKKIDIEFIEGISNFCEEKNINPTMVFIPSLADLHAFYSPISKISILKLDQSMKELVMVGKSLRKNSPSVRLSVLDAIGKLQKGFGEYGSFIAVPSMKYLPKLAKDLASCSTHPVGDIDLRVEIDGGQIEKVYCQGEEKDMYGTTSFKHNDRLIGIRNLGMKLLPMGNMRIRVEGEYKKGNSTKRIKDEKKVRVVENSGKYLSGLNPLSRFLNDPDERSQKVMGAGMFLDTMLPYLYASR